MEDKNELSDIILEKDDNKSMKAKRILIIVALFIVVFLVVLVVMRVVNKPDQQQNNISKLILPPNPTQKVIEPKKENDLFKQVPIEEEDKKESFEDMVKSLKAKEFKKQKVLKPKVEEIKKITETVKTQKKPKVITPTKSVKTEPMKKMNNVFATTGVYVQVGATSRLTPDKKFLAKLTSKNYEYRLLPIDVKGKKVTKILIGPYVTSGAAKSMLGDIKSTINKDAFIYRVK